MKQQPLTYKSALEELTDLVEKLENEEIPVDELALQVKRAADLIAFCQAKLSETDAEVKKILDRMEGK